MEELEKKLLKEYEKSQFYSYNEENGTFGNLKEVERESKIDMYKANNAIKKRMKYNELFDLKMANLENCSPERREYERIVREKGIVEAMKQREEFIAYKEAKNQLKEFTKKKELVLLLNLF